MSKASERSVDPASQKMLEVAEAQGLSTAWDRWEAMQPQCGFGKLGICCRICNMGPCRLNPFGKGTQVGVCGANADTIAARLLARMIAAGSASHSDHGRDVASTLLMTARGEAQGYAIKDEAKLRTLALEYGFDVAGKSVEQLAEMVAQKGLEDFGRQEGELAFLKRAPAKQQRIWRERKAAPRGIDREVVEVMHATHMGVNNDYRDIIRLGVKAALSDGWGGSMIATEFCDVLFGTPQPIRAKLNLGILQQEEVNIVVHGHEPLLSEMIVHASRDPELLKLAESKGAKGITLGGICCTANEILMRHGIPIAGDFLQQELVLLTGAVDAMVVDVQCVMPGLSTLANCYHTKLITTSPKARFDDEHVQHIEFHEEHALDVAKEIVRTAVENFPNRNPERVVIPGEGDTSKLVAGFTAENTSWFLGGRYRSTYRPLNNAIIEGRIRGLAGVVGCCNPNIKHDYGHIEMVKELIRNDVLVVQTGCSAIACAKVGLLSPEAAERFAGRGLREVCEAVGIPPVLHVGACVDNSRILVALSKVVEEGGVGESFDEIPVAAAAPEWMSEKAISIGFYAVASGIFTVFGTPMQIYGSEKLTKYMTEGMEADYGAKFAFEPDPIAAAHLMIEHIDKKREALKLRPMMYAPKERVEPVAAAALGGAGS